MLYFRVRFAQATVTQELDITPKIAATEPILDGLTSETVLGVRYCE